MLNWTGFTLILLFVNISLHTIKFILFFFKVSLSSYIRLDIYENLQKKNMHSKFSNKFTLTCIFENTNALKTMNSKYANTSRWRTSLWKLHWTLFLSNICNLHTYIDLYKFITNSACLNLFDFLNYAPHSKHSSVVCLMQIAVYKLLV